MDKATLNQPSTNAKKAQGASLPKAERLKTPNDFRRVYKSKQWGVSNYHTFNISVLQDERIRSNDTDTSSVAITAPTILGVTVSKKVSKRAVDRNRIKRQIKEFFRQRKAALVNTELVITAKAGCLEASDEQRLQSLELLWEKILKWQRWHLKQAKSNLQGSD